MTVNYHNAIALGAPADAATFNGPLGQLDLQISANVAAITADVAALAALVAGNTGFTQLNIGSDTTLTEVTNAINITRTVHKVDTEGAGATDQLDTINNGVEGDLLCISSVSAARIIEVRNQGGGTGNIRTATGGSVYLTDPNVQLWLYFDGTNWIMQLSHIAIYDTFGNIGYGKTFKVPYGSLKTSAPFGSLSNPQRPFLDYTPRLGSRLFTFEKAAAATYAPVGMAAGTSAGAGALSEQNGADTVFVRQAIANVAGTFGGRRSTTFDLVRKTHLPYIAAVIKIPTDVTNIRSYTGLCAAQVTNVDNLVTSFLGVRYSTPAADPAWMLCTSDGVTTTTLTTGVGVVADTTYLIEGWWNGAAWFVSVNGSTPVSSSATPPADATELGWTCSTITTTATAKNHDFSRFLLEAA